jgi:hypothetical protein
MRQAVAGPVWLRRRPLLGLQDHATGGHAAETAKWCSELVPVVGLIRSPVVKALRSNARIRDADPLEIFHWLAAML